VAQVKQLQQIIIGVRVVKMFSVESIILLGCNFNFLDG